MTPAHKIYSPAVSSQGVRKGELSRRYLAVEEPQPSYGMLPTAQQKNFDPMAYHYQDPICEEDNLTSQGVSAVEDVSQNGNSHERHLLYFATKMLLHNRSHEEQSGRIFSIRERSRIPDISPRRKRLIDEIWSKVESFHMDRITVLSSEHYTTTALHSKCLGMNNLNLLFLPNGSNILPCDAPHHLALLQHRVDQVDALRTNSAPWVGYRVMAACTELAQESGLQIGVVLKKLYEDGILEQPEDMAAESYLAQIMLVIQVSLLMNQALHFKTPGRNSDGERVDEIDWFTEVLRRRHTLDEIFGIDIHSLLQIYHATFYSQSALPRKIGQFFSADDLNIMALRSIGGLSIVWTTTFEDHLFLDLDKRVLYISWFHKPFSWLGVPMDYWQRMMNRNHLPKTFVDFPTCECGEAQKFPSDEILLSWALLFAISPKAHTRNSEISNIGFPAEFTSLDSNIESPEHTFKRMRSTAIFSFAFLRQRKARLTTYKPDSPLCPHQGAVDMDNISGTPYIHIGYQTMTDAALNKEAISYDKFPVYESRLRELRHYMDVQKQKPRGVRQVCDQNAGSLLYYIFWILVLLGGLGILLACFSLAITTVQVVASFKVVKWANSGAIERA